MSVYGIDDESSVEWERLYKFCLVHFQRSVERVKTNYSVVPHGRQQDFQRMVDTLLSEETTEDQFLDTVEEILDQFPNTANWMEWYLEHFRGALVFPAMQNGTIQGHGVNTNGGEVTGRWFKTRARIRSGITKPTLGQALAIMLREAQAVQDDYNAELEGVRTAYGPRSSPMQRQKDKAEKKLKRNRESVVRNIRSL